MPLHLWVSSPKASSQIGARESYVASPQGMVVVLCMVILMGLGLANLYSATSAMSGDFFWNQFRHLGVGLGVMALIVWVPLSHIRKYAYFYVALNYLLLLAVLLWGESAGGAQRWLALGGLRLQPSEFTKLAMALLGAKYLSAKPPLGGYTLRSLSPLLLAVGVMFTLIFLQPDLGTAGIALLVIITQFFLISLTRRTVILGSVLGVVMVLGSWFFVLHDYQKQRILALIHPDSDPMGSSYSQLQSLVAIGSGGSFGKGFLEGTQSHLRFLPSRHTDFIFSVFAEEHGFWSCLAVFLLFATLSYFALEIARNAKTRFCSLLAVGLAAFLFFEFAVNVAMVLGIFPVVGIPLPFFSYGGSSMLSVMVACLWLLMIHRGTRLSSL